MGAIARARVQKFDHPTQLARSRVTLLPRWDSLSVRCHVAPHQPFPDFPKAKDENLQTTFAKRLAKLAPDTSSLSHPILFLHLSNLSKIFSFFFRVAIIYNTYIARRKFIIRQILLYNTFDRLWNKKRTKPHPLKYYEYSQIGINWSFLIPFAITAANASSSFNILSQRVFSIYFFSFFFKFDEMYINKCGITILS